MRNLHQVLRRPLVTEKSTALKADSNKVVFEVAPEANKKEIKQAIEKIFEVKVTGVNTSITRGKMKRVGRHIGFRKNWKKAVVTLEPGTDLDVFGITSFESGVGAEDSE
jgi:large subunit ribosomal protein L23